MAEAGEQDNGSTIRLAIGDELELALPEHRTAGFRWYVVAAPSGVCDAIADAFEQGSSLPGAPGSHRWRFRAVAEGRAPISLEYRRSWDAAGQPGRRFSLTIVVARTG